MKANRIYFVKGCLKWIWSGRKWLGINLSFVKFVKRGNWLKLTGVLSSSLIFTLLISPLVFGKGNSIFAGTFDDTKETIIASICDGGGFFLLTAALIAGLVALCILIFTKNFKGSALTLGCVFGGLILFKKYPLMLVKFIPGSNASCEAYYNPNGNKSDKVYVLDETKNLILKVEGMDLATIHSAFKKNSLILN